MTKKEEHVHKFKRLAYKSGNSIFFCALPDCNKKISIALALGKRSLCWRCGNPFIMTEYTLRLAKPHCENCHKSKGIPESMEEIIPLQNQVNTLTNNLADRLQQTIQQAKKEVEEDI